MVVTDTLAVTLTVDVELTVEVEDTDIVGVALGLASAYKYPSSEPTYSVPVDPMDGAE